jgi:pyruvate/2-oxoglutarate dehydrogenase complex dihydrolipoamide dehydrogenase (E3) component
MLNTMLYIIIKGIYAIGDVCGKVELTPMAIAAGRRLADRYVHM